MKVVWTDGAAEDLISIVDYIRKDSEDAGRRVAKTIYERAMSLGAFPHKGHRRRSEDGYELVCRPWPYVIIYEILDEAVFIEGIIHTSRDRAL